MNQPLTILLKKVAVNEKLPLDAELIARRLSGNSLKALYVDWQKNGDLNC